MRSVEVRRASAADLDRVLSLAPRLVAFGPPSWRDEQEMIRRDAEVLRDALMMSEAEDPIIYVADQEGTVIGFIHLHSVEDYYRSRRHGHVGDIVVAPEAEGQGVGQRLLAEADGWARRLGFDWLSISVFETNRRALAIYETAGFKRDTLRLIRKLD